MCGHNATTHLPVLLCPIIHGSPFKRQCAQGIPLVDELHRILLCRQEVQATGARCRHPVTGVGGATDCPSSAIGGTGAAKSSYRRLQDIQQWIVQLKSHVRLLRSSIIVRLQESASVFSGLWSLMRQIVSAPAYGNRGEVRGPWGDKITRRISSALKIVAKAAKEHRITVRLSELSVLGQPHYDCTLRNPLKRRSRASARALPKGEYGITHNYSKGSCGALFWLNRQIV